MKTKPKRMYIATPINGIPSNCGFDGKVAKARHRIETLIQVLSDDPAFDDYVFTSTFDIHPNGSMPPEHKAMGDCIALVMTCDAIMLDHGWLQSKGCNLEYRAAKIYGKEIFEFDKLYPMDEEMEGLREQLCQTIEVLYEDQYALIIIGETEQDGENTNFRIGGTSVMPDGGSAILLANIISAAMEKNSELRDIIRLAMMVYDEDNPNPIHLN